MPIYDKFIIINIVHFVNIRLTNMPLYDGTAVPYNAAPKSKQIRRLVVSLFFHVVWLFL